MKFATSYEPGEFEPDIYAGWEASGVFRPIETKNKLIQREKIKMNDSCVKLYSQKEKCSWKNLGYLDSITALKQSSNYYQF